MPIAATETPRMGPAGALRKTAAGLACCAMLAANAQAEHVTWAIYDIPPIYILHDRDDVSLKGGGAADQMLSMLIHEMPRDEHEIKVYPINRALVEMEAGAQLCMFPMQRTPEREKFSQSVLIYQAPPPNLIFNTRVFELHPEWRNGARLGDVEADTRLSGQYLASRSFGDKLNALIHDPRNVNLKPNAGGNSISQLKMVGLGRADYAIDNGAAMVYLKRQGSLPDTMAAVPILDGDAHLNVYAICTKGAWGEAVLRKIDVAAKKATAKPEFANAMYGWQSEQELKANRKNYDSFFRMRANTLFCQPDCK